MINKIKKYIANIEEPSHLQRSKNEAALHLTLAEKILLLFSIITLVFSHLYEEQIMRYVASLRFPVMDSIMLNVTNRGLTIILIFLSLYVLYRHKFKEILLISISIVVSMAISYILKKVFQTPRPYQLTELQNIALTTAYGYSFPSLHATACSTIIPYLRQIFRNKIYSYIVASLLILVIISRTYLGVHYLTDILVGSLIGYGVSRILLYYQVKTQILQHILFHFKDKLELRRKFAHLLTGTFLLIMIRLDLVNAYTLLAVLVLGGVLILISRKTRVPVISKFLDYFEREKEMKSFPGKGAFFYILGSFLSLILFEKYIAMASIAIMAYGDAFTTLIGKYFGKIQNPLNPKKHLEGTFIGIITATIAAFMFIDFPKALIASTVGMIVESLSLRGVDQVLDDNVLIPLISGIIITYMT